MSSDSNFDLTDPGGYAFWVDDIIRFSDQDAGGHVNNTAFAAYVESGRVAFVRQIRPNRGPDDRIVVARVGIDYLREAHWPGALRIGCRVIRVGRTSFVVGSGVFKDGQCIATAESVVVFMHGPASAEPPADVRARLQALLTG